MTSKQTVTASNIMSNPIRMTKHHSVTPTFVKNINHTKAFNISFPRKYETRQLVILQKQLNLWWRASDLRPLLNKFYLSAGQRFCKLSIITSPYLSQLSAKKNLLVRLSLTWKHHNVKYRNCKGTSSFLERLFAYHINFFVTSLICRAL